MRFNNERQVTTTTMPHTTTSRVKKPVQPGSMNKKFHNIIHLLLNTC